MILRGFDYLTCIYCKCFKEKMSTSKLRPLTDLDTEKKPSLRISHIVYGREKVGTRVLYLVDEKGGGSEKKIAEQVVLYRWRRRKFTGFVFSGARLSPNIWTVLPRLLGPKVEKWISLSADELAMLISKKKDTLGDQFAKLPGANVLHALFSICGVERLNLLVERHKDPDRTDQYGIPDLFLYATNMATGAYSTARFVEVKKPEESVKPNQHKEIAFLQSLGFHARVLRLVERTT